MAGFVAAFNSIVKKRCDGQIKPEIEDQAVKLVLTHDVFVIW